MQASDIRRILIVGAGTMGQQIALQCVLHGYRVAFYDVAPAALDGAQARIEDYLREMVDAGHVARDTAVTAAERLRFSADAAEAAQEADLLSESVPEDPALKGQVLAQFNTLCPPRTIFTTNTSTLLPSMFADATGRPSQFAALHFHQPVWYANVVDVMPHPGTDPQIVPLLASFARRIGQIPIVLEKEHAGYVFNTMLNALNGAAIRMAANDVATIEDIDRAWMGVMKTDIGPFGILDVVGVDTAWKISHFWANTLDDPQLRANAEWLKRYVDAGHTGVKAGQGFYTYPHPAFRQPDFLSGA